MATDPAIGTIAICTVATKGYLAQVRVLANSYLKFHPQGKVFLALADGIGHDADLDNEPFTVLPVDVLGIPDLADFTFKYTPLELCTALKPFVMDHVLTYFKMERVIFLDCDIVLHQPLYEVNNLLDKWRVILTPHILYPVATGDMAHNVKKETRMTATGLYNAGFVAVSGKGIEFVRWWKARLHEYCLGDHRSIHYDQKWLDLVPTIFPDVLVWRDPGANVAFWNFYERAIECRDGQYYVDDVPLRFFHASTVYRRDYDTSHLSDGAQQLIHDYRTALALNDDARFSASPYRFGAFDNGVPIPDGVRFIYRQQPNRKERWKNPFQTGRGSFYAQFNVRLRVFGLRLQNVYRESVRSIRIYLRSLGYTVLGTERYLRWRMAVGKWFR